MKKELRLIARAPEVRKNEAGSMLAVGVPVVFNELSHDMYGFRERFASGAFDTFLATNPDILIYAHHDARQILGRSSAGTLRYVVGNEKISIENDLPNTTSGRDIYESLTRRDIQGMSFGFNTLRDSWDVIDGQVIRTVTQAELFEFSYVGEPAYPQTSAEARAYYDDAVKTLRNAKGLLTRWKYKVKLLEMPR